MGIAAPWLCGNYLFAPLGAHTSSQGFPCFFSLCLRGPTAPAGRPATKLLVFSAWQVGGTVQRTSFRPLLLPGRRQRPPPLALWHSCARVPDPSRLLHSSRTSD